VTAVDQPERYGARTVNNILLQPFIFRGLQLCLLRSYLPTARRCASAACGTLVSSVNKSAGVIGLPRRYTRRKTVTHSSTNRARCSVTSLIRPIRLSSRYRANTAKHGDFYAVVVCLSVRPSAGIVSKRLDGQSWFSHGRFLWPILNSVIENSSISKNKGTSSLTLPPPQILDFRHAVDSVVNKTHRRSSLWITRTTVERDGAERTKFIIRWSVGAVITLYWPFKVTRLLPQPLHRESKKQDTKLLAITSPTIIRFSNFFSTDSAVNLLQIRV